MLKLNLGCGTSNKEGYVNVDKYAPADIVLDLEKHHGVYFPWPWLNNSVDEVIFNHSLEHMGESTAGFIHILQQLYRVCKNDAKVNVVVPHPRHDDFLNDPTHVRIITPDVLNLLSMKNCDNWQKNNVPNTQLARHIGVNFEIFSCSAAVDERFFHLPQEEVRKKMTTENNIIKQYDIWLKVIK